MIAARACTQAQKFGAQAVIPQSATRLNCERKPYTVGVGAGVQAPSRTVIITSGARYLIRRIEDNPAIVLRTQTEIMALEGGNHLEHVRRRERQTGNSETRAAPITQWLDGRIVRDAQGFIKTGSDLTRDDLGAAHWRSAALPTCSKRACPACSRRRRPGRKYQAGRVRGRGGIGRGLLHTPGSPRIEDNP
jgi:thioredoxin reductase